MTDLIFQAAFNKNNEALEQLFRNFNYVHFTDKEEAEGFDEVYTNILYQQQQSNPSFYDQYKNENYEQATYDMESEQKIQIQNTVEKISTKQMNALNQLMQGWQNMDVEDQNVKSGQQKHERGEQQKQVENYYQIYNAKKAKKNQRQTNSYKQDTSEQSTPFYEREPQNPQNFNNQSQTPRNNSKKQLKGANQFAVYKRQLANLEDDQQEEKVIATQKPIKKRIFLGNTQQNSPKIKSNQIERKDKAKSTRIYKIDNDSIKKHSLKKQKQAQTQMMANIQFLRSLRGSVQSDSQKKQWKQSRIQNKNLIDQLKNSRRKQLQSLGFVGQTSTIQNNDSTQIKISTTDVYALNNSSHILPQLKQSRKKGQIFKPAAFSIYTIQKTNQLFYNNYTK